MKRLLVALLITGCAHEAREPMWDIHHSPAAKMAVGSPYGCIPIKPREMICFTLEETNQVLQEAWEKRQQEELDHYPPKEDVQK